MKCEKCGYPLLKVKNCPLCKICGRCKKEVRKCTCIEGE